LKISKKNIRVVAVGAGILVLFMSLLPQSLADVTLGTPNELLNPLGTYLSWSFEASGYWSSNYGGYFSSSYKLHQTYSWYTTGSSAGNYQMWRNVESSCLNSLKGRNVMFAFFFLPSTYTSTGSVNNARAVVTVYATTGTYTYTGSWIKPVEFKWHNAHVNAYVSSYATSVKVTIEGSTSFCSYIDVASLAIRDTRSQTFSKGKLALDTNIYEWRIRSATYDGYAFISPSLFAEKATGYYIRAIKLYIELLPQVSWWDWFWYKTKTTQEGQLFIEYPYQTNNKGHQVDPAAVEEARNKFLESADIAIDFIAGVGFALLPITGGLSAGPILVGLGGASLATNAKWLLWGSASDPNDRAAYGGEDYSAHEQWDYPTSYKEYQSSPFVSSATGSLEFSWVFKTSSATSFQMRITAYVNWGIPVWRGRDIQTCWLDDAGWDSLSQLITVYA
jgi:hypothetical protein